MSSDKQLCIATGIFPPDKGGPAQFVSSFSAWLGSKGFKTSVISLTDGEDTLTKSKYLDVDLISRARSLPIRMLKTSLLLRRKAKSSHLLVNGLFLETFLASIAMKMDYVAKVPGDIVWERARNTGRTTLDIDDFQGREPFRFLFMRWAFTQSLKRARLIISPSQHLSSLIMKWGVDKSKIEIVPNSVRTELFRPDSNSQKTFDIITVSRLVEWKGIKELILAAHELSLKLLIVGSGPQESELRSIAKNLSADVVFAGERKQEDLPELINRSKCFVLNSKYEGSPHSLIEAMSCGAFVVAKSSTGTRELIESGIDGVLVNENENLSNVLRTYFKDDRRMLVMGEKARQKVLSGFSREDIFIKIHKLVVDSK